MVALCDESIHLCGYISVPKTTKKKVHKPAASDRLLLVLDCDYRKK